MACLQDVFDTFFAVVKGFVSECARDLRFCISLYGICSNGITSSDAGLTVVSFSAYSEVK